MSKVMTIPQARYARNLDAFLDTGMFDSPEIKARRAARIQRDAEQARWNAIREERFRAQAREEARQEVREEHERQIKAKDRAHDQELKDLGASLAGGVALLASVVGLAMLV